MTREKNNENETLISCTAAVHSFCNIFGYCMIPKKCISVEKFYHKFFIIIKVLFAALSVYCFRWRFEIALIEQRSSAVFSTTRDLLYASEVIVFYVEAFSNTTKAPKIRRFWLNLLDIEKDLKQVGINLNYKRIRTIAATALIPECTYMSIFLIHYLSNLMEVNFCNVLTGNISLSFDQIMRGTK